MNRATRGRRATRTVSHSNVSLPHHALAQAALALVCIAGCRENPPVSPPAAKPLSEHSAADKGPQRPAVSKRKPDGKAQPGAESADLPRTRESSPQPVYRSPDDRPRHDDAALAALGIRKYESSRLRLYSDIDPNLAQDLPRLMDAAYIAWEEYFGPLPPDRAGAAFQMTGYLMKDAALFRETGLLPDDLPPMPHGRNRGRLFWMHDQTEDYYRRHLMLHEGTHCYMVAVPGFLQRHVWYMEGMAELFGTHEIAADGVARFCVMPDDRERFAGLGRIRFVNDDVRAGRLLAISDVTSFVPNDYLQGATYAWSWALCEFLSTHPHCREKFRLLGREVTTGGNAQFDEFLAAGGADLAQAWLLFAANLCDGYDTERACVEFRAGEPLAANAVARIEITADRGWQSTGVRVDAQTEYRVTAEGRFIVARRPDEEVGSGTSRAKEQAAGASQRAGSNVECEPQGISFRYHAGRPLGMLVGTIREEAKPQASMADTISLGRDAHFVAPVAGTLYLRVNDFWNELADNAGMVSVQIKPIRGDEQATE